jgi:prepilin-type N-terminal cleavage/methylation domain-containing protein
MAHPVRSPSRQHRGFTLIELMIVVSIIGLLSSIAIPEFVRFSRRAKTSEREVTIGAIMRALNDHWINKGVFPGGTDVLNLPTNPPYGSSGQADGSRKPLVESLGHWAELNWRPHGTLYFHYTLSGSASSGVIFIIAESDLDTDGLPSRRMVTYRLEAGIWQVGEVDETGGDDF